MRMEKYDVIVIGAGACGLVVANGAVAFGKKVLLIENENWGGDCTNFGCVPSKSIIASSKISHAAKFCTTLGLDKCSFPDAEHVLKRVQDIVSSIRKHEEPDALRKKGIFTLTGRAHFVDSHTLCVIQSDESQSNVQGKYIVIATGSYPRIPDIPGLVNTPFLTNETIFSLSAIPKSLAILGGGPIGSELGQAFLRLGSKTTLIHSHPHLLEREERVAQSLIEKQFLSEGMELELDAKVQSVTFDQNLFTLLVFTNGKTKQIQTEKLLVASGRMPNIQELNLQNAKINFSSSGIPVDCYGRTNVSHIFAIGDVTGPPFFTHRAEHEARAVLTTLILPFWFKKKIDNQAIPRVTYTSPEIASIGLSEEDAEKSYGKKNIAVYHFPLEKVDRAITQSETMGFFRVVTKKYSSQILGATLVAPNAGDMLPIISLAMYKKIPLRQLASLIFPYPTYALGLRQTADLWLKETIATSVKSWFK